MAAAGGFRRIRYPDLAVFSFELTDDELRAIDALLSRRPTPPLAAESPYQLAPYIFMTSLRSAS
jgi:hypothetical protein